MSSQQPRSDSGYSTLEVVVAFLVLSLAMSVGIQSIASARMGLDRAQSGAEAGLIARRTITEQLHFPYAQATAFSKRGDGWEMIVDPLESVGTARMWSILIRVSPRGEREGAHLYQTFAVTGANP